MSNVQGRMFKVEQGSNVWGQTLVRVEGAGGREGFWGYCVAASGQEHLRANEKRQSMQLGRGEGVKGQWLPRLAEGVCRGSAHDTNDFMSNHTASLPMAGIAHQHRVTLPPTCHAAPELQHCSTTLHPPWRLRRQGRPCFCPSPGLQAPTIMSPPGRYSISRYRYSSSWKE